METRNRTFVGIILTLLGALLLLMQPGSVSLPLPAEIPPTNTPQTTTVNPTPTLSPTATPTAQPDPVAAYGPNLIAEWGGFEEFTASPAQISPELLPQDAEPDGSHVHPVGWREWYQDKNYDDPKSPAPFREGFDPTPLPDWYPQGRNAPDLLLGRPEFTAARALSEGDDARRVFSGGYAAQFFCFFRTCNGGYYTLVSIPAGVTRCRASVQFQASVGTNTDLSNPDTYLTVFPALQVRSAPPLREGTTYFERTFRVTADHGADHFYDQYQLLEGEFDLPAGVQQVVFAVGAQANFPSQNDMYFDSASFRCQTQLVNPSIPDDINALPTPTPRVPASTGTDCRNRGEDTMNNDLILYMQPGIQVLNVHLCPDDASVIEGVLTQQDNPAVLRQYEDSADERWVYVYTIRTGEIIEGWVKQTEAGVELARVE